MRQFAKIACTAIALSFSSIISAAPLVGSGGGYFGTAWFTNGSGIVVGAYPTWAECNTAFQQSLQYRVDNWGWVVSEINHCSYTPPFGGLQVQKETAIAIRSNDAAGSLAEAERIMRTVQSIRSRFNADAYEAALSGVR